MCIKAVFTIKLQYNIINMIQKNVKGRCIFQLLIVNVCASLNFMPNGEIVFQLLVVTRTLVD